MIIQYEPKFWYLNVFRSGLVSCYTASYNKELGLDFHYEMTDSNKEKEPQGFRLWSLKNTLDKISELFPGFERTKFGDGRNIAITPEHVTSLLTALVTITEDEKIRSLRDQLNSEKDDK